MKSWKTRENYVLRSFIMCSVHVTWLHHVKVVLTYGIQGRNSRSIQILKGEPHVEGHFQRRRSWQSNLVNLWTTEVAVSGVSHPSINIRFLICYWESELIWRWRHWHYYNITWLNYSLPSFVLYDNKFKTLLGNSEEKRPLGRTRRRWDDTFKTNLKEIRSGSVDWIHLV